MAKPPRSPLLGYNHNIGHLGQVFHVQTEDSGPLTPRLFTHMFFEGTILASIKHEYDAQLTEDKVRLLMQNQHKAMIRDLLHARFDERLVTFFRARGVELAATAGALPSTPMLETPSPVLAVTAAGSVSDPVAETLAGSLTEAPPAELEDAAPEPVEHITTASFVAEPASAEEREADLAELARSVSGPVPVSVPLPIPSGAQHETRPFASRTRGAVAGAAPSAAAGVPSKALGGNGGATARMSTTAPRRSPFVRNVEAGGGVDTKETARETTKLTSKVAKVAAADGVVVQRTVRVGGPPASASAAAARPQRARRPAAFALVGRDASPATSVPASAGPLGVSAQGREPDAPALVEDHTLRHASIESLPPGVVAAALGSAADPLHAGQAAQQPPSRPTIED